MKPHLTITLVRHGESTGNTRGAFLGRNDPPLTHKGENQARALGRMLASTHAMQIMSSPLRRARRTAELIARELKLPITLHRELMEQDFGLWDGLTLQEAARRFPDDFQTWVRGSPNVPPTGGESLLDLANRLRPFYQSLKTEEANGDIIMVSHGSVIQASLCLYLDTQLCNRWPYRVANGSFAHLMIYEHGACLDQLNPVIDPEAH